MLETGGGGEASEEGARRWGSRFSDQWRRPCGMGVYSQSDVNPKSLRVGDSSWMVRSINKCDHGLKVTPTPRVC